MTCIHLESDSRMQLCAKGFMAPGLQTGLALGALSIEHYSRSCMALRHVRIRRAGHLCQLCRSVTLEVCS